MEVIETPKFNDLEGCPNTFSNIVYVGSGHGSSNPVLECGC